MRVENWRGYNIRFVKINGEWWAILKDICDALGLKTFHISQRLDSSMLERVRVEVSDIGSNNTTSNIGLNDNRSRGENKTRWMLAVNELGIYEALFASRKLEARKFRIWAGNIMQKLRKQVGLEQYEVMRMTEPEIQNEIDCIIDSIFWDPEKKMLMQSVTIAGGDVDQVPFLKTNGHFLKKYK